jgi:hypothetical protein
LGLGKKEQEREREGAEIILWVGGCGVRMREVKFLKSHGQCLVQMKYVV